MRDIVLEFKNGKITYTIPIKSKVTVLQGDSATGKTELISNITDFRLPGYIDNVFTFRVDAGVSFDTWLSEITPGSVVFLDEDTVATIRAFKDGLSRLWHTPCQMVLAYRGDLVEIAYSYKDIYTLRNTGKTCTTLQRLYEDFDLLPVDDHYLCEDSGTGLTYFSDILPNVKSTYGNRFKLSKIDQGTLILDGASIGQRMRELTKSKHDLFLPESFEYLLLKNFTMLQADSLLRAMPDEFLTLEQFCTHLCTKLPVLGLQYSKHKMSKRVLLSKLCDGLEMQSKFLQQLVEQSVSREESDIRKFLQMCDCVEYYALLNMDEIAKQSTDFVANVILRQLSELGAFGSSSFVNTTISNFVV